MDAIKKDPALAAQATEEARTGDKAILRYVATEGLIRAGKSVVGKGLAMIGISFAETLIDVTVDAVIHLFGKR